MRVNNIVGIAMTPDGGAYNLASTVGTGFDLHNNNPLDSSVIFQCLTCGRAQRHQFQIQWFKSHADAVGWAVTNIKTAQQSTPGQVFRPQYVAGNAVMGPQNLGHRKMG